jgi:hypothetical protein
MKMQHINYEVGINFLHIILVNFVLHGVNSMCSTRSIEIKAYNMNDHLIHWLGVG